MSIFDLIFLAVFFSCVLLLVIAFVAIMDRHRARLFQVLQQLGFLVGIYLSVVIIVSIASPGVELSIKEAQCSDDWCIAVEDAKRIYTDSLVTCIVTFRLSSRARRQPQWENSLSVQIVDGTGRHFSPVKNSDAMPFNTVLQPAESILIQRKFVLPKEAQNLGLIINRRKFPGMFIIGDEQSLLHKRTIVLLH